MFPRLLHSRDEVVAKILGEGQLPWEDAQIAQELLPRLRGLKRSVLTCLSRDPHERPDCDAVLSAWNKLLLG